MRPILMAALLLAGCANAPPRSSPMPDGSAAAPPEGWFRYCMGHIDDEPRCRPADDDVEPSEPLTQATPT